MTTGISDQVIAPQEVILPTVTSRAVGSGNHGEIFISGGNLCYVSGTNLVVLSPPLSGAEVL